MVLKAKKSPPKKKVKYSSLCVPEENEIGYTGKFHNHFPWQPVKKRSVIIDTAELLKELCDYMTENVEVFAYDTETNCLDAQSDNDNFRCADITISWGELNNYDIILGHVREEDLDRNIDLDVAVELLKPVFEREDITIVGHNLKFDLHVLRRLGIRVRTKNLFDTMLASWLCDENKPNGLKDNSSDIMGVSQTKFKEVTDNIPKEVKKQFGYSASAKVKDFGLVLVDEGTDYCTDDSFYTWCLYLGYPALLEEEGMDKIYYNRSIPFLSVLLEMEEKGICVDKEQLETMRDEMQADMDKLQYEIYELAGVEFNIGSPQQKAEILYGYEKPHTPIIYEKANKQIKAIYDSLKEGSISSVEAVEKFEKQGCFVDEKGKVWKSANRNYHLINNSFGFPILAETETGAPSCDKTTLMRLAHQEYKNKRKREGVKMCQLILEYSKLDKLKGTFADGILEKIDLYKDGKCHPNFNQIGTDSGRISCSNPNLQQLPKADEEDKYQIRSVFIGSPYYVTDNGFICDTAEEADEYCEEEYFKKRKKILAIDYHNLEMVCLCYFSKDKNLTEMFANDDDAHGSTAVNMFNLPCTPTECKKQYPHLRQAAKTINFMLMYGGGANTLYENLKFNPYDPLDLGAKEYLEQYGCKNGVEVAQLFIDRYFESYSGVAHFIRDQKRKAHKQKFVHTIIGRKRRLPDINSSNGELSSKAERLSVNAAIQGTAGDITSGAQIRLAKERDLEDMLCYMLLQVHDELVYELPEEYIEECVPIIKYDMEHPFGDKSNQQVDFLRADYDVGDSYQEAK